MSLSIFYTAGYPSLNDTLPILETLSDAGISRIEIGIPFSDPLADGPVIQESSSAALKNGMNLKLLFRQLKPASPPLPGMRRYLMGYLNPVLQFGMEHFLREAAGCHINGVILPDLPPEVYEKQYSGMFDTHGISCIFLITPQTSEARIRKIDELSDDFIYVVSAPGVTGTCGNEAAKEIYFQRIREMDLKNELVVGFGIHSSGTYEQAMKYAHGAIVGTAFISHLKEHGRESIPAFLSQFKSI